MAIYVDVSQIWNTTASVTILYKNADGVVVILNKFSFSKPEEPAPVDPNADDSHNFKSDVASETVGTAISASGLMNGFTFAPGAGMGDCKVEDGYYTLTGINDIHTTANGKYAFTVDVMGAQSSYMSVIFVRGIRAATPEGQFYGTDKGQACGGAGIYICAKDGQTLVVIKSTTDGGKTYQCNEFLVGAAGEMKWTVVDQGDKLYILESGTLQATITTSGTKDFGITGVGASEMAETVTITPVGGEAVTVENAVVAATNLCDVGVIARSAVITFTEISMMPASSVEVNP